MTTIRKTISISKKDETLQNVIKDVPSYEVSHVIRQLMYDGLKYRALVEGGIVNDLGFNTSNLTTNIAKKEPKSTSITPKRDNKQSNTLTFDEFEEEFDINSIKLEQIDEEDEDLEDILLNNG